MKIVEGEDIKRKEEEIIQKLEKLKINNEEEIIEIREEILIDYRKRIINWERRWYRLWDGRMEKERNQKKIGRMEKEKREIEQNKMGMVREKVRKVGDKKKGNGWLEQTKEIIEYYEVTYPKEIKKKNNKQKY